MVELTRNITLRTLPVKRSQGHSAVAGAAYRAGERLRDSRLEKTADYTARSSDVWHKEILAPAGAPEWVLDRERLWNEAELAERRKDGRPARDVTLGLPWLMTKEEHEEAARSFVEKEFVDKGHVVDLCFHKYGKRVSDLSEEGRDTLRRWAARDVPFLEESECAELHQPHVKIERNAEGDVLGYKIFQPHAHAYVTPRAITEDGFEAKRNREFDKPDKCKDWRWDWGHHVSQRLEKAGYDFRVSAMGEHEDDLPLRPQDLPLTSYHIEQQGKESVVREEREFNRVHNDAVRDAAATMQAEQQGLIEPQASRFERVRDWFQSMRASFTEWREYLNEKAQSWFQREEEPPDPQASPPPEASAPETHTDYAMTIQNEEAQNGPDLSHER